MSEDGNSAVVTIEFKKGEDIKSEKVDLIKEDENWYVEEMSGSYK